MSKKDSTMLAAAPSEPTQPIVDEPRERGRLPTTYFVDTEAEGRQMQIAASLEVRNDGTLAFYDDEGAIVAAYHRDQWQRVQSERQSNATASA